MADRFRHLDRDRFDVIVVGAGAGGLTAAALLARAGQRVLVLDQHYVAGGNTTIFKRRGYEFDVGLHYIGRCHPSGAIPRILRAAGATGVEFEEMDPEGFDTLVFPDFRFRMPRGLEPYRERLLGQFPDEARAVERYIELLRQVRALERLPGKAPLDALRTLPGALLALRYANRPFADFLDSCTRNPRLRAVLSGQSGDYAQPPSRASTVIAAGLTLHYLDGAYFPKGGGQVISDRLAESIEQAGGKILLRARVRRIVVENGRATGVDLESPHLGARRVHAPVVLSNADLKRTMLDLVGEPALSGSTTRKVRGYEMSPALGMLFLGVRRDPARLRETLPRTNFWIFPDYDVERAYATYARGEFATPPPTYVTIASLKDPTNPRLAPPGITNLQLMSVAPSSPTSWGLDEAEVEAGHYRKSEPYAAAKRRYADSLIDVAEQVLPGLRGDIVYEEVATPITHARYTLSTGGTSYGIALTPEQFLWKRPGPRTEIDGLYLCGASCRTGHGIGGVMASGVAAAAAIVGKSIYASVYSKDNAA